MDWLLSFPHIDRRILTALKTSVDAWFRDVARALGSAADLVFHPLHVALGGFERFMLTVPWPLVIAFVALVAWLGSRSIKLVLGCVSIFVLIGLFDMWEDTMKTVSMIFVCSMLTIVLGIPLGIATARSERLQKAVLPLLDVMQTMPSFVYLIPVVMLLGIGRVPGLIAVVIYSLPPIIRLTNLGIRLVDREVIEAADAFGSTGRQKLFTVQLPLALPTIMAGVNQAIMMALGMVVIAAMIGVQGLGQPVLKAIANQYFTLGVFNGLAIVGIAIVFDRISQAYGERLQRHRGIGRG
ncbi:ABC transporter permease [Antarcticirhabdus aurantiaca]|uniref:Proline/glycine betaine ABC transporter permease n=1 Tax=Antarcticirhabdus aurantiaca TaxID=2606717 RepID=A0ACD4NNH6_9HYPH|nr:proline/glycine betaine ABC transporter permease [Antarcticirhabdus aurantiaca]WAJ28440.1 proline/glycine betaine ABC transporter permease [Jeongeuplla avenae]